MEELAEAASPQSQRQEGLFMCWVLLQPQHRRMLEVRGDIEVGMELGGLSRPCKEPYLPSTAREFRSSPFLSIHLSVYLSTLSLPLRDTVPGFLALGQEQGL